MNKKIWDDAYKRAAEMAPVRPDRRMRDILYGDVPTFMELPHAHKPAELKDTDIAFLGMGYEGVKIDSPHTYLPARLFVEVMAAMAWRNKIETQPKA